MLEKKSTKKVTKKALIACAAAAIMMVGGVSAYFTATDTATNTWTIGNVAIDLQEPEYDASDKENIVPNQVLAKDPMVENTGTNDAFVFMKVSIPKASVKIAEADGTVSGPVLQELFDYSIDSGWVQISKQEGTDNNTYVYAYAANGKCVSLAADASTPVLFKNGEIKFRNVVEGQLGSDVTIPVTAYGIQTENLGSSGSTVPADVWAVLSGQISE